MTKEEKKTKSDKAKILNAEVDKINARIEKSGLKDKHIAEKIKVNKVSFSLFKNKKEGYVTQSMINRTNKFLDSLS